MSRWVGFAIFTILGLALIWCGLRIPAHLRAVDGIVLRKAGAGTPSLIEGGLLLVTNKQMGAARFFLAAARSASISNSHTLSDAVSELAAHESSASIPRPLAGSLPSPAAGNLREPGSNQPVESFAEFIIRSEVRTKALQALQRSRNPLALEFYHLRLLTNTALFPPSVSSSGQALDAAVATAGLLVEEGHFPVGLRNEVQGAALKANQGGDSRPIEQVLMDLLSLGQRFDWSQLTTFVARINDTETLRTLTGLIRGGDGVPVIYTAVCLTGNASGVASYLSTFSQTGLSDLRASLKHGAGGVNELLKRKVRLCNAGFCDSMAALGTRTTFPVGLGFAQSAPAGALALKWFSYLLGGFFIAVAFHYARRVTPLEKPLEVRGFHLARETLFALGFLLVVLLLSEPFLTQGSQKERLPFRLQLSTVGGATPAGNSVVNKPKTIMNPGILLTLLLFFVLQGLLYLLCLLKLAEIRRQRVPPRIKLKLLENEEHLFDAGLYLGFVGTIISLILVSLNVIHFSLMAAYSCTCFGIVFVVIFKIFHLRPTRRKLLLEAEAESPEAATPTVPAYGAPV